MHTKALAEKAYWPSLVFLVGFILFILAVLFLPPSLVVVLFFLSLPAIILFASQASPSCPSCGRRFAAKVLETKEGEALRIRFHEGEPPASDAIRSAYASKLDLDENEVFVQMTDANTARITLPKDALRKVFTSETDSTIWGPEGTGPARGWCTRMAQAQERAERRKKHLERTFSELWRPTKEGDATLIRFGCKSCEHTWTSLRVSSGD
jgi:hypothetical protein